MRIEVDQSGKIEQTEMDTVNIEKMIQGALTSKPASTMFSAKLRHGLAWHPSSPWFMYSSYLNLSSKND